MLIVFLICRIIVFTIVVPPIKIYADSTGFFFPTMLLMESRMPPSGLKEMAILTGSVVFPPTDVPRRLIFLTSRSTKKVFHGYNLFLDKNGKLTTSKLTQSRKLRRLNVDNLAVILIIIVYETET